MPNPGDALNLFLKFNAEDWNEATDLATTFVRATVTDNNGDEITGSPVALTYDGSGSNRFSNSDLLQPLTAPTTAKYEVFKDAGFSELNDCFYEVCDVFEIANEYLMKSRTLEGSSDQATLQGSSDEGVLSGAMNYGTLEGEVAEGELIGSSDNSEVEGGC